MIKELTCISEEGLADLDFQDIYFDEWAEYIGECITSCNKVENCLVSEYDPDLAMVVERSTRRWSAAKHQHPQQMSMAGGGGGAGARTGRLALPGIGTVLEVPLLVAKRLHPKLGVRSHPRHNHPHYQHQHPQYAIQQQQGCGSDQCITTGGSGPSSPTTECNYSRGGNCAGADAGSSSSSASPTTATRVYHHHQQGKGRGGNMGMQHFPAIDEDSV